MKKILTLIIIFFSLYSFAQAGNFTGTYSIVGKISENCDFIGNVNLDVNYNVIKIKAEKWRWLDTNKFKKKLFKGKIRKNNADIFMQARALGYKHLLKGTINNDRIFLTFSSSHTEMNEKFGGCSFEFVKQ